jgi:hypothetical protein
MAAPFPDGKPEAPIEGAFRQSPVGFLESLRMPNQAHHSNEETINLKG